MNVLWFLEDPEVSGATRGRTAHAFPVRPDGTVSEMSACAAFDAEFCDEHVAEPRRSCTQCVIAVCKSHDPKAFAPKTKLVDRPTRLPHITSSPLSSKGRAEAKARIDEYIETLINAQEPQLLPLVVNKICLACGTHVKAGRNAWVDPKTLGVVKCQFCATKTTLS